MNWQDIQKVSPSLTDMWVEICCELLGNESDFFRGRVKQVEWIDGFPRFHLTNLVRFDPLCCSWTPVGQADEPWPMPAATTAPGKVRNLKPG